MFCNAVLTVLQNIFVRDSFRFMLNPWFMKRYLLIVTLGIFLQSAAQDSVLTNYVFQAPPPLNTHLLQTSNSIILIAPEDNNNLSQLWTRFDDSFTILSKKRLVLPENTKVVRQNYYESNAGIIRLDQSVKENRIEVDLFLFSDDGDIKTSQNLVNYEDYTKDINGKKPYPFLPVFSADKSRIALVKLDQAGEDSLKISAIVASITPATRYATNYVIHFDGDLQDPPAFVLNNDGVLAAVVPDKFKSYTLGSTVYCYFTEEGKNKPVTGKLLFPRKKIKTPHIRMDNSGLLFSALFSEGDEKESVAGWINGRFDLKTSNWKQAKTYTFSKDLNKKLKRIYGQPVPAKDILNYLHVMTDEYSSEPVLFATLVPFESTKRYQPYYGSSARVPYINTTEPQQRLDALNRLVSAAPVQIPGYPVINTFEQAYTVTNALGWIPGYKEPSNNNFSYASNINSPGMKPVWQRSSLLYFATDSSSKITKYQFEKIFPTTDEGYYFNSRFKNNDGSYSALYYHTPGLRKPYLNKLTIDKEGNVSEKNLFEDSNKILDYSYPHIIRHNKLIAFYYYIKTNDVGIIAVDL